MYALTILKPPNTGSPSLSGLSLYHALLKQSSKLALLTQGGDPAIFNADASRKLIQYRFRADRALTSPTQIANGLHWGYSALDLLAAAATKDSSSITEVVRLLNSAHNLSESTSAFRSALSATRRPTSPQKSSKIAHLQSHSKKTNWIRRPESKPVLVRPLPLDEIRGGKRRVPNLVATQGIPFLRYSKPQPIVLSRMIRQKSNWQIKKWGQRGTVEEAVSWGRHEDDWDTFVEEMRREGKGDGGDGSTEDGPGWCDAMQEADVELETKIREDDTKNILLGRRMWDIVVQERELAAKEKAEAKAQIRGQRAVTGTDRADPDPAAWKEKESRRLLEEIKLSTGKLVAL